MQLKELSKKLALSLILCLILASCSSLEDLDSREATYTEPQAVRIGTDGALIAIESDNVRAAGYDEVTMVMTIQFRNGALYEYYGVPADLWISFVAAQPDPWSQVGYPRLVVGGISYKRVG